MDTKYAEHGAAAECTSHNSNYIASILQSITYVVGGITTVTVVAVVVVV